MNEPEFLGRHAEPGTEYAVEIRVIVKPRRFGDMLQRHRTEDDPFSGHVQPYVQGILHDTFAKRFLEQMNPA